MTDSTSVQRKINGASELRSVVRTMKAVAAANITQYEQAVLSLADYVHAIELSLGANLRQSASANAIPQQQRRPHIGAVIFGSDQGLVGQFNESIAEYAISVLAGLPGQAQIWAVGDRVQGRLLNAGLLVAGTFPVPGSVKGITGLAGQILLQTQGAQRPGEQAELHLFHNRPTDGANYAPVRQRLLPLDNTWRRDRTGLEWPTHRLPQIMGPGASLLPALIGEYLFVSLFRAGAESLASEQASRLAAMQRAERSIEDMLGVLRSAFHRSRQSQIDEELFDVVSGFEALKHVGSTIPVIR
jgi:F-type H+-transporting ATPase subunit gamma